MRRHKSLHPLSHQHHNGLALCVLVERALASDASEPVVRRLAAKCAGRFDLELVNHFQLEEQVLFPAVTAELGPYPLVDALIAEHRAMEQQIAVLRHEPTVNRLQEFATLLRAHIRREENELFPSIQDRLSPATMQHLGDTFEARAVRVCLEP
ncbi:hemerythrin domain-containing protein [uncultured Paludibaculum sp.]|uniref:hemerythrin domain-containing protein n=1 Tax=uncultured Paludibaculum sp. TaxID=1765020 RepID=UPI00374D8DEF